jgi:hypothetical protein
MMAAPMMSMPDVPIGLPHEMHHDADRNDLLNDALDGAMMDMFMKCCKAK